ncbi:predicted protein [Aspergillus nidulans FGSC A4]|nr:predicted protein [Aspergillus nidulans FGSC A4]|eukprot:XP_680963.1 predicted protein [Aspergillus nidulans FGSC A4]
MESSSRPARLTTAERKRLTDRKAQRQRRERIKTYIARLEKTLEELTAASGNGMEATLLKQLEQQRAKTERLTNVINHIHEVLEETRSLTSPTPGSAPSTQGESASPSASWRLPPVPKRLLQLPQQSPNDQTGTPFTISADLATRISLHSQNPRNSGTRNYFQVVNESISNVAKEQNSILPSTTEDDEDLAIRAILCGWDSVNAEHGISRTDNRLLRMIRLKWPYELRDVCKYNVAEDRYRFSSEFDAVYYDVRNWTIDSPQLQILIESGPDVAGFDFGNINGVGAGAGATIGSAQGGGLGVGEDGDRGGSGDGKGFADDVDSAYWDRFLGGCDQMGEHAAKQVLGRLRSHNVYIALHHRLCEVQIAVYQS